MIRKKDILNILAKLADKSRYLDKNTFLSAVIGLKEVEGNTFIIKKADNIRGNIIKYQRRVSIETEKGYLTEYIERIYKLTGKHKISICIDSQTVTDKDIVIHAKDLIEILGITKPTLKRLENLKVIKRFEYPLSNITIDGQDVKYKSRGGWFRFYDLGDIRKELNTYIKKKQANNTTASKA